MDQLNGRTYDGRDLRITIDAGRPGPDRGGFRFDQDCLRHEPKLTLFDNELLEDVFQQGRTWQESQSFPRPQEEPKQEQVT